MILHRPETIKLALEGTLLVFGQQLGFDLADFFPDFLQAGSAVGKPRIHSKDLLWR